MELPPFNYPNPLGLFGGAKQVNLSKFIFIDQKRFGICHLSELSGPVFKLTNFCRFVPRLRICMMPFICTPKHWFVC